MEAQQVAGLLQAVLYGVLMDKEVRRRFRDVGVFVQEKGRQGMDNLRPILPGKDGVQQGEIPPYRLLALVGDLAAFLHELYFGDVEKGPHGKDLYAGFQIGPVDFIRIFGMGRILEQGAAGDFRAQALLPAKFHQGVGPLVHLMEGPVPHREDQDIVLIMFAQPNPGIQGG